MFMLGGMRGFGGLHSRVDGPRQSSVVHGNGFQSGSLKERHSKLETFSVGKFLRPKPLALSESF